MAIGWLLMMLLGFGLWLYAQAADQQRIAVLLSLDGAVSPASADYLIRGIRSAEDQGAELVVIMLDTPGGLDSSMRSIIKKMLASSVPVAVYVHPAGARAASAGTFMLYGAHIAAMTPATNLGSASPVSIGGDTPPGLSLRSDQARLTTIYGNQEQQTDQNGAAEKEPRRGETAMERKVLEDAVSYIRGLAERYDRNADWAEEAVREAVNITAREALEKNVIDIVATDLDDLLMQINGMTVYVNGVEQVLNTENLQVLRQDPDWRAKLLAIITDPNVAYILMLIGIYGLIFELANPGALYPGIIGSISLILAFFALQVMPVNYAGLAL
ncbi:MAG TPA: nodulation protein NfeD, partial [Halothiobacillaceae bacterium]|nr:nodulation protein NfeD [Halothiobacillaceae bacterium]